MKVMFTADSSIAMGGFTFQSTERHVDCREAETGDVLLSSLLTCRGGCA